MRQSVINDLVDVCWESSDLDFWKVFFPVFLQRPFPEITFLNSYTFEWVDYDEDQFRSDLEGLGDRQLLDLFAMMYTKKWLSIGSVENYLYEHDTDLPDLFGVDLRKQNQSL